MRKSFVVTTIGAALLALAACGSGNYEVRTGPQAEAPTSPPSTIN